MANQVSRIIPVALLLVLFSTGFANAGDRVWTSLGPEGGQICTLAIDPMVPQTLYAGTGQGGVFKSTNGGRTWNSINTGLPKYINPGLPNYYEVSSLAIDPTTSQTIYASTGGAGIFKSINGGSDWSPINMGPTN